MQNANERLASTLRSLETTDAPKKKRSRRNSDGNRKCCKKNEDDGCWPLKATFEAIVAAFGELKKMKVMYELQVSSRLLVLENAKSVDINKTNDDKNRRSHDVLYSMASKASGIRKAASLLRMRFEKAQRTVANNRKLIAETQRLVKHWAIIHDSRGPRVCVGNRRINQDKWTANGVYGDGTLPLATQMVIEREEEMWGVEVCLQRNNNENMVRYPIYASNPWDDCEEIRTRNDAVILHSYRRRFGIELWSILAHEGQRFRRRGDCLIVSIDSNVNLIWRRSIIICGDEIEEGEGEDYALCKYAATRTQIMFQEGRESIIHAVASEIREKIAFNIAKKHVQVEGKLEVKGGQWWWKQKKIAVGDIDMLRLVEMENSI